MFEVYKAKDGSRIDIHVDADTAAVLACLICAARPRGNSHGVATGVELHVHVHGKDNPTHVQHETID